MVLTSTVSDNLDNILAQLIHKVGKYQIKNIIFLLIPLIYTGMYSISYTFTARNLDYRCHIPECDVPESLYKPPWLLNAVPRDRNNNPSRCERYSAVPNYLNNSSLCPAELFNQSVTLSCKEFVFNSDEVNILNDFGLMCDENLWKLTIVGTINNIGQVIFAPMLGCLADRFGRRILLLSGLLLSTTMGILRSLSSTYTWFLSFEFLDSALGSGAYNAGCILSMELVPPNRRVICGTLLNVGFATGTCIIGIVAWTTHNWRELLLYLYFPGYILAIFFWLVPESARWLLSIGRHEEAKNFLRKAAKESGIELSETELNNLESQPQEETRQTERHSLKSLIKSRILLLRLVNCSFCCSSCMFVYAGMSQISVAEVGNLYLNYILVCLIEIPAYFTSLLILDKWGRRLSLCGALQLTGIASLTHIFISADAVWLKLAVFLLGKYGISLSFTIMFIFNIELFPTSLRNSAVGICAMFGKLGATMAPQLPLLAQITESLPLLLFGVLSVTSGLLVLLFPETLNKKLPDTIEDAEQIGQTEPVVTT